MSIASLPPVLWREAHSKVLEPELVSWLQDVVYGPLFDELEESGVRAEKKFQSKRFDEYERERTSAKKNAVLEALRSGKIWYADDAFGSSNGFSSDVSKQLRNLGAHFDVKEQIFLLPATEMPFAMRSAISQAQIDAESVHKRMEAFLTAAEANLPQAAVGLRIATPINRIIADLNQQFSAPQKVALSIAVRPELQPAVQETLRKRLTDNLSIGIKNFAAEEIPELRRLVAANFSAGARLDRLSKIIESRFGVGKRKADFLASNETNMLAAAYREERAKEAGSVRYRWHTMGDQRVRHDHRELDGRIFFWSDPPIVNHRTGKRGHPGTDYGCRCWSGPIVDLPKLEGKAA